MHISLRAEPVFYLLGFPFTNSLIASYLVIALLTIAALAVSKNAKIIPSGIQNVFEEIIESFLGLCESVAGPKARTFFPLVFTFFIFILFNNWFGLLPFVGSLGIWQEVAGHGEETRMVLIPLFRAASADLNTTLALAIISVLSIQYFGVKSMGLSYFKRFFNFTSPINAFVGILELISDFAKMISFSFRLFGNVFAGEVLIGVIIFLLPVIAPLPFLGLEIFVGFIQALVFAMLTLVFLNTFTVSHEEEH